MRRNIGRALAMGTVTCLGIGPSVHRIGTAQAESPEASPVGQPFFAETGGAAAEVPKRNASVARARLVAVNLDRFPAPAGDPPSASLRLNLFPEVEITALFDRVERRSTESYTWFGTVAGEPLGRVTLVKHRGVLAGSVRSPRHGTFELHFVGDQLYRVEQLVSTGGGEYCGTESHGPVTDAFGAEPGGVATHEDCDHDPGSTIDLLAVYTGAASAAAGGTSAIEAQIQLHVDRVNEIYLNSGIIQRMRLVHAEAINYDEDGSLSEHRARITGQGDGFMDSVHALRDEYGADIVSLFYNMHNDRECGGGSTPEQACVTDDDCGKLCKGGSDDGAVCTDDGDCGKLCIGGANDGLACNTNADCPSSDGTCVMSVCSGGDRDGDACSDDADCEGNDGACDGACNGSCNLKFTGLAWQLTSGSFSHAFESNAFNCVKWDSTVSTSSGSGWLLAHEAAHNMGAGHDRDNVQSGGLFSFSWGQRFLGDSDGACKGGDNHGESCETHGDCPDGLCKRGVCNVNGDAGDDCADDSDCPSLCLGGGDHGDACVDDGDCADGGDCRGICTRWRTVMAYSPGTVVDHFSNPGIAYDGESTGSPLGGAPEAHNAKTLNDSRDVVANFRASHYWVDFAYPFFAPHTGCPAQPFTLLSTGIDAVPKRGTLHIVAGSSAATPILSKPMRIVAEGGSVFIGVP